MDKEFCDSGKLRREVP